MVGVGIAPMVQIGHPGSLLTAANRRYGPPRFRKMLYIYLWLCLTVVVFQYVWFIIQDP